MLNDKEVAALDLQRPALMKWKKLSLTRPEEMAKEGFYLMKSVLHHCYCQGWRFLTLWEGYGVDEATWESYSAFLLPMGM